MRCGKNEECAYMKAVGKTFSYMPGMLSSLKVKTRVASTPRSWVRKVSVLTNSTISYRLELNKAAARYRRS